MLKYFLELHKHQSVQFHLFTLQKAEGKDAKIRYNCHPNAGKKDPETGKKKDFIEDTTTLFSDVNKALEDHSVGGVAWHSIIPYPDIPENVIAPIDVVEELAERLEEIELVR